MFVIGIAIYLSIGLLVYSYIDYIYRNLIDSESIGQFEIKTFESKHSPSLIVIMLLWPIEVTAWSILFTTFVFTNSSRKG
jgi:hypothetical protein